MRKDIIMKHFLNLNCVVNFNALEEYIDFCINNDVNTKIPKETSSHHILPIAKTLPFKKFRDFNAYPWNKAELTYHNHYIAHYLLAIAINHLSILNAFTGMHNKDFENGRISHDELITKDEYAKIYKLRNTMISNYRKEKIETRYGNISRASFYYLENKQSFERSQKQTANRMKNNNIVNLPGVLEKMRNTKKTTFIDGKNLDTIGAEKAAETMKIEFELNGNLTTTYKENGKKLSTYLNTELEDCNGNKTTIAKEKGKNHSKKLIAKGNFYLLKNVFDETINEILSAIDVRNISPGLEYKTKDNYLGKSKFGQNYFIARNKKNLIGLYVEKLQKELQ